MRTKRKQVSADKKGIRVVADIKPGPASLAQKTAWRKLFARLITECQCELKAENEAKREQT